MIRKTTNKRLQNYFFLLLAAVLVSTCSPTDPGEAPELIPPKGYQENIPWPSLADSPWPMAQHDPQCTGRSQFNGPTIGNVLWTYTNPYEFWGGVSITPDSRLLLTADSLICLDSLGKVSWTADMGFLYKNVNTPLVRNDGSIICSNKMNIYAFDQDGKVLWTFNTNEDCYNESISIDKEGNLYFTTLQQNLYCLNPDGQLRWKIFNSHFSQVREDNISPFSPDGKTLYIRGQTFALVAIDIVSQSVIWTYENAVPAVMSPQVDNAGNIYVEVYDEENYDKLKLISVTPEGKLRWESKFSYAEKGVDNEPCMDFEGNVYFGGDTLYSVNYNGELNWKRELNGICDAPILCDKSGVIYVTTYLYNEISHSNGICITSYNNEGNMQWQVIDNNSYRLNGSGAIVPGKLIQPTISRKIIAIE